MYKNVHTHHGLGLYHSMNITRQSTTKQSLLARLYASFAMLFVLLLISSVVSIVLLRHTSHMNEDAINLGIALRDDIYAANLYMEKARIYQREFFKSSKMLDFEKSGSDLAPKVLSHIRKSIAACERINSKLEANADVLPFRESGAFVQDYLAAARKYLATFDACVVKLEGTHSDSTYEAHANCANLARDFDVQAEALSLISQKLLQYSSAEIHSLKDAVEIYHAWVLGILGSSLLLGALVILRVVLHLRKHVMQNIFKLTKAAEELRAGNFDAHVEMGAEDELGQLGFALNTMASRLKAKVDELMQTKARIEAAHDEMEQSVLDRTMELDQANRLLASEVQMRKQTEKDIRKAKEVAEEATKAKSEFLANMSHEIRTPMNAILGMAHLAKRTELTPVQQDYLNKIDISAKSLLDLINDILDLSKVEAGMLNVEETRFSLNEVMEQLSTIIFPKASEKELEFLISVERDVPSGLVGDPLRLLQVLVNLCNNAVKFTDSGEILVTVALAANDDGRTVLRFFVKDCGIGIKEEQVESMFEAFTQADASTTRQFGGTGLGLNLCRKLVSLMHGDIGIQSTYGKGSTFWFELPFTTYYQEQAYMVPYAEFRGMRTLVVDDNPSSLRILQELLTGMGLEVSVARSGPEALEVFKNTSKEQAFELLVVDWRMPKMDGVELAEAIVSDTKIARLPHMLMVSAYTSRDLVEKIRNMGFIGLIHKPVTPSTLFNLLVEKLGTPERRENISTTLTPDARTTYELGGTSVLLVEDNEINRQVAFEVLSESGVQVHEAENGQKALEFLEKNTVDLVLMDVQMPVMNGYDATDALRKQERLQDLPIIAMTAHAMAEDKEKTATVGMNDHISKPFNPDELVQIVSKWIGNKASDSAGRLHVKRKVYATAGALPNAIEGIDINLGLMRSRGNVALFKRLLLLLDERYANVMDTVAGALEQGKTEDAVEAVHSLKGAAGMLGATALFEAASELELSLDSGETDAALLERFGAQVQKVLRGIRVLKDVEPECSYVQQEGTVSPVNELVAALAGMRPVLAKSLPVECRENAEQIQALCWPPELRQNVAKMLKLIAEYNFTKALHLLGILEAELEG